MSPEQDGPAGTPTNPHRDFVFLFLLWSACALFLVAQHWQGIVALQLPDTDDNLRLQQIRDLLAGQHWFDLRQYRLDPPGGADIHWSRLIDLPYALLITLLSPLTGSGIAERMASTLVPLLILGGTMATLARIAVRCVGNASWAWPVALLMTATPVVQMMSPLRIDHHGAQLMMLVLLLWGLISQDRTKGGLIAGMAMALSLVIGVEMLPYLAIGAGCATLFWIMDETETLRLRALALALAIVTTLGLLLFIPPAARFSTLCDALTSAYFPAVIAGSGALLGITFLPAARWPHRLALAVMAGGIAAAALAASGGVGCIVDPYRAIDTDARTLWLSIVSEARPLWMQSRETSLSMPAFPLIGLGGALWMWARSTGVARRPWAVILLIGTASIILCILSIRAGIPAQLLAIPGATALMYSIRQRLVASPSMLVRVLGTVAALGLISGVVPRLGIMAATHRQTPAKEKAEEANAATCEKPAVIATLNRLPPATIMAGIDLSPALLVHSHHRAIAGPYHRNGSAIAGMMKAFAGSNQTAKTFIRAHRINYVLICPGLSESSIYKMRGPDGFQQQLLRGALPSWLERMPAHPAYRLYRVRP